MPQIPETVHELTVGQLSARSGAAVSALHFYESKGLISSRRTSGNQRRYHRDALRRVAFVRAAQRVGIPLATIREALAELPEERTPTREDWARLSRAWRSELDERIKQLGGCATTSRTASAAAASPGDLCALQPRRRPRRAPGGSRLMVERAGTQPAPVPQERGPAAACEPGPRREPAAGDCR